MSRMTPIAAVLLCVAVWSFIPVVSRLGQTDVGVFQFLLMTNLLSLVAVGFCLLPERKKIRQHIQKTNIPLSMLLGFLGCFFYYLCLYYGYAGGKSLPVLVMQYLWPTLVFMLAVLLFGDKVTRSNVLSIILGLAATVIAISQSGNNQGNSDFFRILVVFTGAVSFALFSILSKLEKHASTVFCVFLYFFWASLFSLISWALWGTISVPGTRSLFIIMVNGILVNGLSYILWINALANTRATSIASLVYATPVLSMVWMQAFFGEQITTPGVIAIGMIIASGLLLVFPAKT